MRKPLARSLVAIAAAALVAGAPAAASADPPGNNGTVKIDGVEFDSAPNNEPHVGCTFQIDFYGYDEGSLWADGSFVLWPPTPDGSLPFGPVAIGGDPAGGGTDLDASLKVDIASFLAASGVSPQPNQGWHVYLTVHADGSIGADVKHKVFWVTCGGYAPTLHAGRAFSLTSHQAGSQTAPSGGLTVGYLLGLVLVFGIGRSVLRRKLRHR